MLSPSLNKEVFLFSKIRGLSFAFRWRIQERGPGGSKSSPPLFLDQSEARRAEKFFFFFKTGLPPPSPSPLSEGLDPPLDTIYKTKQHRYLCTGPERATNFPLEYTLSDQNIPSLAIFVRCKRKIRLFVSKNS